MKPYKTPGLPLLLLASAALSAIVGCGSGNPAEEGYQALQAKDFDKAMKSLGKALDAAEPGTENHRELAVARCQAQAHVDAKACRTEFLGLVSQTSNGITEKDFELIASALMEAKAYNEGALLIDQGIKGYPENERFKAFMDKLIKLSKEGNEPGLASTIEGLGYGGE